jgi:hypothetical protein
VEWWYTTNRVAESLHLLLFLLFDSCCHMRGVLHAVFCQQSWHVMGRDRSLDYQISGFHGTRLLGCQRE